MARNRFNSAQRWVGSGALALLGSFFLSTLQAADNISASLDSSGKVIFANEPSPSSSSRRVLAATGRSQTTAYPQAVTSEEVPGETLGEAPPKLDELIEATAHQHQLDPDLIRAIVQVESNFNPYAVSPRGARGLMQLIPATARRFGVRNSFDARSNLDGGARYLKHLMGMFRGDLPLTLAAYNAGEDAVERSGGVPPFRETQDYLRKIGQIYPLRPMPGGVPEVQQITKFVDARGIVHFSNLP